MQIDLIALMKISKIILLSFSYSQIILHAYRTCSFIIYQGLGNFFHIAHYEKFSLRVKFRFIQMYYYIFLYKKRIQLKILSDTHPWRIHTDLLAICALCSRHVTVMHGLGLSRVPTEPETLLVRLTKAPEVDQSSGRPHD